MMRYLVAFVIGIGALFGVNSFTGIFSMPRPWGSLLMGATVGITMVVVLLIWELVKPSHKDAAPAKPAMSEEERANARAERRARLAAEAGVSPDENDGSRSTTETKSAEAKSVEPEPAPTGQVAVPAAQSAEPTPESAESSIEEEPADAEPNGPDAEPNSLEAAQDEPDTLAPDEFDEEATGSSLEDPPTGEPGVSVDALEDAESADTDGAADDDPVGDEPTTGESDSKN